MTFSILIFAYRLPGTTPAQFREHYENVHVSLIRSLSGEHFPTTHTRHYIARGTDAEAAAAGFPASALMGAPTDFEYDVIAELVFEGREEFAAFSSEVTKPENAAKLHADEEKFLDRGKLRIVALGETTVTRK